MISPLLHGIGAYAPGARVGPARWPHHDLIIVVRGEITFTVGDHAFSCRGGTALLVPPRHRFEGIAGDDGGEIWVQHFHLSPQKSPDWPLVLPKAPTAWAGAAGHEWSRTLMREASLLQTNPPSADNRAALLPHVLYLLLRAIQDNARNASPLENAAALKILEILEWLDGHPHPLPSLEHIADRAGWSPSHFREQFRLHNGRSLGAHLRTMRQREAERLLRASRRSIKEISAILGYSDPVAFHRAFVAWTGKTPARFRAAAPVIV